MGNGSRHVTQTELAEHVGRSRTTIIAWERRGLPIARRGGPGRPTLYDLAAAEAWINREGVGLRADFPAKARPAPAESRDAFSEAEAILSATLSDSVAMVAGFGVLYGLTGSAALRLFDLVLLALLGHLEKHLGRAANVSVGSEIGLLFDPEGRAALIERASAWAAQHTREEFDAPAAVGTPT